MIIYIHTLNFKTYQSLQEIVKEKCKNLLQYNSMIIQADVVLYRGPDVYPDNLFCEITLTCGNKITCAKAKDDSYEFALDSAVKSLLKSIGKQRKELRKDANSINILCFN